MKDRSVCVAVAFKILVPTLLCVQGSTRSGVLGEASINLTEFAGFGPQLDQRALPLKNCSAGSVLHVS